MHYSRTWGWFALRLRDGGTIRLSALLTGLPSFAQALLGNVEPTIIGEDAVELLRRTAEGNPPSVWYSRKSFLSIYLPAITLAIGSGIVIPVIPVFARSFDV